MGHKGLPQMSVLQSLILSNESPHRLALIEDDVLKDKRLSFQSSLFSMSLTAALMAALLLG